MPVASICTTCGTQYPPAEQPPERCAICCEPRQYVLPAGQHWTDPQALARTHTNGFRLQEPGLLGIGTYPHCAIGQRALLLRAPAGNVAGGAQGRGALLAGDIVAVAPDCRQVSFMRSYPNMLPLGAAAVRAIAQRLAPWRFDRIYSAFWDRVLERDAAPALEESVERYVRWVSSTDPDPA